MKVFFAFLLVAGFYFFGSPEATARNWPEIQKSGTLQIATDGTFPPFNFVKDGKINGFEYELGLVIAQKLKLKSEWKTSSFDSLLIGLEQDRFDVVIASHGITPERAKVVDFSDPHYCTGVVMVSKNAPLASLSDLKGKTVAVQIGTIFVPHLKKVSGIKAIKTLKQDTDCLQSLLMSKVDVWVSDKFVAEAAEKAHPDGKLVSSKPVLVEKVGMAVKKGNHPLLEQINKALSEIKGSGEYLKLSQKYFSQDISCEAQTKN